MLRELESNNVIRWISAFFAMAVLLVFGEFARAGVVDTLVHTTDASPISLDATQKDIRKASQDLVNGQGAYAPLAGRPFVAVYSVAGAKNVLQLTSDATGQNLTITGIFSTPGNSRRFCWSYQGGRYRSADVTLSRY